MFWLGLIYRRGDRMFVVLISGKAGHGKDTFALYFKEIAEQDGKKVLIIKYGDILKYVLRQYYNWDGNKDEAGRELLQRVGTDIFRVNNPDTWVNCVIEIVKGFGSTYDYVLVPDVRFPNEINNWMGSYMDFSTVRINRYNSDGTLFDNQDLTTEQKKHISEVALDDYIFDYVVNNFELEELKQKAEEIYEEVKKF